MKGVLILAHGSREQATKNTITQVVDMVRQKVSDMPIEIAYMEFCHADIATGIQNLVDIGVDDIKVIPYFLFEGIHIKEDIPKELDEAVKNHPNLKITMGNTLGVDKRLADILVDRINE